MPDDFTPRAFGVTRAPDAITNEQIAARRAQLSATTRLSDIADEYAFYHPGLLYNLVPLFGKDPFVDFVAQSRYGSLQPLSFKFDNPVISGFEQMPFPGWGHTLHALEQPVMAEYLAFVGAAMFVDRSARTLWRIRFKEFKIIDPVVMKNTVVAPDHTLPRITVTALCLDTNRGCWFMLKQLPWQLSVASTPKAFKDTCELAEAVLGESPYPLGLAPAEETNGE